jgi:endonuclease/exonuclease/phosphatase family metal-dependent hydrolase
MISTYYMLLLISLVLSPVITQPNEPNSDMGLMGDLVLVEEEDIIQEKTQIAIDILKTQGDFEGQLISHNTCYKQEIIYKFADGKVLQARAKTGIVTFLFSTNYHITFTFQPISTLFSGLGEPIAVPQQIHEVTLHQDYDKKYTIIRHTWRDIENPDAHKHEKSYEENFVADMEHHTPKSSLKIVVYNIWNYNAPWYSRMKLLVDQIKAEGGDIVAMQEVRYDYFRKWSNALRFDEDQKEREDLLINSRFQADQIRRLLTGHQFVYDVAMTDLEVFQGGFHVDEGLATFSKLPILDTSALRLSRVMTDGEDGHNRLCQHSEIEISKGRKIHVFNTHLSLSPRARKRIVIESLEYMNQFPAPQIYVGDFNDEPDSWILHFLTGSESTEDGLKGNFKDAWVEIRDKEGLTEKEGFTFLSNNPTKRIDFILYRNTVENESLPAPTFKLSPKEVYTIGKEKEGNLLASDHFGLVGNFLIESSQ